MSQAHQAKTLNEWLAYIESLHPKSIAMGLERISRIIDRLQLHPKFTIITVAGTNGKGSTCAMLESIYQNAGYKVACYTSPHLIRYNERVRVNGREVTDSALCEAFATIDNARSHCNGLVELTYFEVGTLAAIWHFMQTQVDIAILEVGLGGRLDAVNAFEPDCAIVTSIDLDHMEFLGDTREKIGLEKAGVYRPGKPAICGDSHPPASLIDYAYSVNADYQQIHINFDHCLTDSGWQFLSEGRLKYTLPLPALEGHYQLNNAACAIAAVEALQYRLAVPAHCITSAMRTTHVAGRFQTVSHHPQIILDVAHNPHAARALAANLHENPASGNTIAVFGMLADKDIAGVIAAVQEAFDVWYVADIDHLRGAKARELKKALLGVKPTVICKTFSSAADAYAQACLDATENDKIVVFGSFFTVSDVMQTFTHHTH